MAVLLHPHQGQGFIDAAADLIGAQPQILRAKSHIFFDGCSHDLIIGILEDHPYLLADGPQLFPILCVLSPHDYIAAGRQEQCIEKFGQG